MPPTNVEAQLLAAPVKQLDLSEYLLVTADTTVRATVERLRERRQNCALVIGKGTRLIGILTDRDVLRRVVAAPDTWDQPVETVMTPTPQTVNPDAPAGDALRLMEEGHYRNVPVVNANGLLRGNLTHFAVLKFLTDHFPAEVYNLPPDPTHYAQERDGG
jgi:CBS domain-containing protein